MHKIAKISTSALLLSSLCLTVSKPAFAGDYEFDHHDTSEMKSKSSGGGGLGTLEVIGIGVGSAVVGGFIGHGIGKKKGYNDAMRDYSKYINQSPQNHQPIPQYHPITPEPHPEPQAMHNTPMPEQGASQVQVDLEKCVVVKTGEEFCLVR